MLKNEYYIFQDGECYFFIRRDEQVIAKIKIDAEDYNLSHEHLWILSSKGYVISSKSGNKERVNLHRLVMGLPSYKEDGRVIDHFNHNKHDNRKKNLKICSPSENAKNRISKETSIFSENIYRQGRIYE